MGAVWTLIAHSSASNKRGFQVGVKVAGTSNDAAGARHVTFVITNEGRQPVLVCPVYGFENRSGVWRSNWIPKSAAVVGTNLSGTLPGTGTRLNSGDTHKLELILPFEDTSWRACFTYLEIWPASAAALDDALRFARIPRTNNHNIFVRTYSDWQ